MTKQFLASSASSKHIIDTRQFKDRKILLSIFELADDIKSSPESYSVSLHGKSMISLFYEPSTRTRLSFEMAMLKLGGVVSSTENAAEFSSAVKGESLEDTIRVINGYMPDVIVIRHSENGAALRAAMVSDAPIINAGDGSNQHPTQALLDLYTIYTDLGKIDGLKVGFAGDLKKGRTVRSLAYLLSQLNNNEFFFVSPQSLRLEDDIRNYLKERGIAFRESESLYEILPDVDVLYVTRLQKERHQESLEGGYYVLNSQLVSRMKEKSIIMHPLPRTDEIALEVDSNPRAAYFRQSANGLYVRMALLCNLLKN